jgi:hypothetical protein
MTNRWWWLGALGLWGCGADVDLGQADSGTGPLARGAALVSFAPVHFGMCALFDNDEAYCWGEEGSTLARRTPTLDAARLAGPGSQGEICGVEEDGTVACSEAIQERRTPKLGVARSTDVSVGFFGGCALGEGGKLHCWAHEEQAYHCEDFAREEWLALDLPSPAVQVDYKDSHGCAVTEDGRLFCFGSNLSGESGQLESDCVRTPTAVPGIDDAVEVALGMSHTCVRRTRGTVTCFGDSPVADVPGLSGVVHIEASRIATCALESSGTLKCWGTSLCGALGISEECGSTQVPAPIAVQAQLDVSAFGMADGLTCAVVDGDYITCWGFSDWDSEARGSPVPRRIVF